MFGFATNYQATQNIMHVHNDTGDAVREEANTLHRVAMDAARAEYSAHLAETVHRLDEENSRRTLELHEQFAESRAFFSAQVSQMRGAISAEVNEAVSQRTAQHSAFAQSLHAETVVMENSEKAVGEQRDSILAENHAMQDTINGLNDTVERLRNDLERAQREMVRRDPQPASSFQNVSSQSFLDKRGISLMIRVFFQRRMHKLLDLCLRLFHSRVGLILFLVQCSLISKIMRDSLRSKKTAEVSKISRQISRMLNG